MEVNDDHEDEEGGEQVHHIRQILTIKRLLQRPRLVTPREQQMEKTNNRALKLRSPTRIHRRRGKRLPHDILADIRGDKEGDARADAISLLQHFVEENDNHAGGAELQDQEDDDAPAEIRGTAVDAGGDVDDGLTECQNQGEY